MIDFLLNDESETEKENDMKFLSLASDELIEIAFLKKKELLKIIQDSFNEFQEKLVQELKDSK